MDLRLARQYLTCLGYEIRERQHEWAECLLLGHDEVWQGVGANADHALTRALTACFPSEAARQSLNAALAALGGDADEAPAVAPAGTDETATLAEDAPCEVASTQAEDAEVIAPAVPLLASPVDDQQEDVGGEPPAVLSIAHEGEQEAIADLEDLAARIESQRHDLGLVSPKRQRLVLLGWLAEARAQQEEYPRNLEIAAAVPGIVKTLRSLSESWWPGMIFQREARPPDTRYKDLRGYTHTLPASHRPGHASPAR